MADISQITANGTTYDIKDSAGRTQLASHDHSGVYLPLTGGTISGDLTVNGRVAEGSQTTASGSCAHSEGWSTQATGNDSHAQNSGTIAASASQTALGRWNVADTNGTYALIIGNGTYDQNRSNALTVDWSGNIRCAGNRVRPNIALRGLNASTTVNANSTLYHEFDFTSILSGYPSDASWFPYQVNHQSYGWVVTTNWWTSGKKVCVWYLNVTGSNASGNAQCGIVIIY